MSRSRAYSRSRNIASTSNIVSYSYGLLGVIIMAVRIAIIYEAAAR
jgi:hypothetical protein